MVVLFFLLLPPPIYHKGRLSIFMDLVLLMVSLDFDSWSWINLYFWHCFHGTLGTKIST